MKLDRIIRPGVGLVLFILQCACAVAFFASLGANALDSAILAGVGALLEIVKRIAWSDLRAGQGKAVALVLGVSLAALSAVATLGFEMGAMDSATSSTEAQAEARARLGASINALDMEAASIRVKLEGLPANYVTLSLRYSARLDELAARKAELSAKVDSISSSDTGRGVSTLAKLSGRVGLEAEAVSLVFFTALSILLELAVFTTTGRSMKQRRKGSKAPSVTPERKAILEALADKPSRPKDLADLLGKNPSTTRVELRAMLAAGLVRRDDSTGLYSIACAA